MAFAYLNKGTAASGTNSVSPSWAASLSAGEPVILGVAGKYPPNYPTTPGSFTLVDHAISTSGVAPSVDNGDVFASAYWVNVGGGESGALPITVTSGNSTRAQMLHFTWAGGGVVLDVASAVGEQSAETTSVSITFDADPGITAGDHCVIVEALNQDAGDTSSPSLTCAGITFGTLNKRETSGASTGDDVRLVMWDVDVVSGTSSGAPVLTHTHGVAATAAAVFVRMREVTPPAGGGLPYVGSAIFRNIQRGIGPR